MPNMDDIAFFESAQYEHRGGIWSDASRRARERPLSASVLDDTPSTMSEPASSVATPDPFPKSEDLLARPPTPPLDASDVQVSSTLPSAEDTSGSTRRRSWFSSVRSDDMDSLLEAKYEQESTDYLDDNRGRSLEVEKGTLPRSQSTPGAQDGSYSNSSSSDADDTQEASGHSRLSLPNSRRSSLHNPSGRGHTHSESLDNGHSVTEPSTPPSSRISELSRSTITGSPSSFLSTLKSRAAAADKQALSNTAKEAMRKWGVNWGGLKKDLNAADEMPDHGVIGSRGSRPDSVNGAAQKARASYAEVRAAVAERKGRERNIQTEEHLTPEPSSPIPIPEGSKGKARAVSGPSSLNSASSSLGKAYPMDEGNPPATPSIISRTNTESSVSEPKRSVDSSATPFSPIHVQPQAKTMTIPGIHASHRGEVMSMGYVAPQPPTMPTDSKLKNPVYRLWKSPTLSGQQDLQEQSEFQQSSSGAIGSEGSANTAPAPAATVPRPIPPPLPPRRSTAAPRPPVEAPAAEQTDVPESLQVIASKDTLDGASLQPPSSSDHPATDETQLSENPVSSLTSNGLSIQASA